MPLGLYALIVFVAYVQPMVGLRIKGSRKEEKMNGRASTGSGTYPALHSKSGSTHLLSSEKNIFDPIRNAPPSLPVSFPVSPSHPEPHFFFSSFLSFTSHLPLPLCPFRSIPYVHYLPTSLSPLLLPCAIKLTHNCTIDN